MTLKTFLVEVGVALVRPPKTDEYRRYAVSAESGEEAELIAQQMAQITSIMATESVVTDWPDDPYIEMSDANPERRNNGCMIYQVGDRD